MSGVARTAANAITVAVLGVMAIGAAQVGATVRTGNAENGATATAAHRVTATGVTTAGPPTAGKPIVVTVGTTVTRAAITAVVPAIAAGTSATAGLGIVEGDRRFGATTDSTGHDATVAMTGTGPRGTASGTVTAAVTTTAAAAAATGTVATAVMKIAPRTVRTTTVASGVTVTAAIGQTAVASAET